MLDDTIEIWDNRRNVVIASNFLDFAVNHWIHSAERAIQQRGLFAVALSGGSTPKAIFSELTKYNKLDWTKVWVFWSDERAVPENHPESNYKMAMDSGFQLLPIPAGQIFRMRGEGEIEKNAKDYEEKITHFLGKELFDLVMLGVGVDGHTASLFPDTEGLKKEGLVTANVVPQLQTKRMTLTFRCINQSKCAVIYANGKAKKSVIPQVLNAPIDSQFPASRIGTPEHPALWILDKEAGELLN